MATPSASGENCYMCCSAFEKQLKGWKRHSILTVTSPTSISKLSPTSVTDQDLQGKFICPQCLKSMSSSGLFKRKKNSKRKWTITASSSPTKSKRYPCFPASSPASKRPTLINIKSPRLTPLSTPKKQLSRPQVSKSVSTPRRVPTPRKSSSTSTSFTQSYRAKQRTQTTRGVCLDVALELFDNSRYKAGFQHMLYHIPAAKTALFQVCAAVMKKERCQFMKNETILSQPITLENLEKFTFEKVVAEAEKEMPLMSACLDGFFPKPNKILTHRMMGSKKHKRPQSEQEAGHVIAMRKGLVMAMALYTASPQKAKFIQANLGIDFWRQGATQKLYKTFNLLGITQSVTATRSHVDKFAINHDKKLVEWKQAIEGTEVVSVADEACGLPVDFEELTMMQSDEDDLTPVEEGEEDNSGLDEDDLESSLESSPTLSGKEGSRVGEGPAFEGVYRSSPETTHDSQLQDKKTNMERRKVHRRLNLDQSCDEHHGDAEDITLDNKRPYSLCYDNVQMEAHRKHQREGKGDHFHMWALSFGVDHRVNTLELDNEERSKAKDLSSESFLPTQEDYMNLRQQLRCIVADILSHRVDAFKDLKITYPKHQYVNEMAKKTEVVNLGVHNVNPGTTHGSIQVMEELQALVPRLNGKLLPVLLHGDGKSVEMMVHAQRARAAGATPETKLQGVVPSPQEFHKEMILLQDFMDVFLKNQSEASRGTLAHIRNLFSHNNLKASVKDNFQHAWDMMEFATEGHVLLCAMEEMGTNRVTDRPADLAGSRKEQQQYLMNVAAKIVDICWNAPPPEDLRCIAEGMRQGDKGDDIFPFCSCLEDKEEDMVLCCSYMCKRGWMHLSCAGLQVAPERGADFYCSPECQQDTSYIYCVCHEKTGGVMVQCHMESNCCYQEWYHVACLKDQREPGGRTWYCSEDCALGSEHDDPVQAYAHNLLWSGLNLLTRRHSVRHGNGMEMVTHWKMDLVQSYWKYGHCHYFKIAHRFLAAVSGFLPERLQEDMIWNRLANLQGKEGHNIPLDLVNEFINGDFKDLLLRSHGRYTESQIQRCAHMCGPFGKEIDRLFALAGLGAVDIRPPGKKPDWYAADVVSFVEEYADDHLFAYMPGREHFGFVNFSVSGSISAPMALGEKLALFSRDLDFWEEVSHYN